MPQTRRSLTDAKQTARSAGLQTGAYGTTFLRLSFRFHEEIQAAAAQAIRSERQLEIIAVLMVVTLLSSDLLRPMFRMLRPDRYVDDRRWRTDHAAAVPRPDVYTLQPTWARASSGR